MIFVPYGAPGDLAEVEVVKTEKKYARARILKIIEPSPHRVDPPCKVFYKCGGCQLQHMDYEFQLKCKDEIIKDSLRGLLKICDLEIRPVIKTPCRNYRNKVQWVYGGDAAGLYSRGTHKIIDLDDCLIQKPLNNLAFKYVKNFARQHKWEAFNELDGSGLIRYVASRVNSNSDEILLTLVATSFEIPHLDEFVKFMTESVPKIKGIMVNKNKKSGNVILTDENKIIWGKDCLNECIKKMKYKISALSFFQVNIEGLEKIIDLIIKFIDKPANVMVDAYCGVGTLALQLAHLSKRVYGFEENKHSINDAKYNAKLNAIKNIKFLNVQVKNGFDFLLKDRIKPDLIILDPPRAGCEGKVIEQLVKLKAQKIIYISCNPSTLARDLKQLIPAGYNKAVVQPVDMFPQTYHVETVALLSSV